MESLNKIEEVRKKTEELERVQTKALRLDHTNSTGLQVVFEALCALHLGIRNAEVEWAKRGTLTVKTLNNLQKLVVLADAAQQEFFEERRIAA